MQAFSIPTEGDNDADAHTHEVKPTAQTHSAPKLAFEMLDSDEQDYIRSVGVDVKALLAKGDTKGAFERIEDEKFDADAKAAFWSLLDSKERSALKTIAAAAAQKAA